MHEATKRELEALFEKEENYEFNSVTNKTEVENQNQEHNAKKENFHGASRMYKHR